MGASAKKFALRAHNGPKLAFDGALGEFFRGPAVVGSRRASLSCRVPGTGALLLAALTLQCAAKPYWWHGGQPAQVATSRVNVRIKGAYVRRMCSQKQKWGLTARRHPDALNMPRETTEEGPQRVAPLVVCGGRAVGTEKSRYQQHIVSYNPSPTRRAKLAAWTAGGRASRWPEIWRDSWCRTELGGTADTARNRPDLYVRNGNAQMANSGNGQVSGAADMKNRRPVGRRLFVRHGGLEPSTR